MVLAAVEHRSSNAAWKAMMATPTRSSISVKADAITAIRTQAENLLAAQPRQTAECDYGQQFSFFKLGK
jgi:hypothetical protein